MEAAATAGAGDSSFEPSLWDDFFVSYTPPCSQMSEEWMRERADELKVEVHRMFEAVDEMRVADSMILVDALQRLGIDNHFQEEINTTMRHVYTGELEMPSSKELHMVALRFRLLRQHGFFLPTDVFDEFRDGTGNFNTCLTTDPKGLVSLYNAAHMAVPGEDVLDDAIAFTRTHLVAMKGSLVFPIADQISRTLDIPLTRYMPQLETMHFIIEYEQEDGHNASLLELARLDYSLTRSAYLKELGTFCLWWEDFYKDVNLTYSRDRGVEIYFWGFGVFPGEENTRARIIFSKVIALISLMDDTFDSHATFEDCKNLNEAIQRWDESAASVLPEYLRMFYTKILSCFNEFEDILELREKYRVAYVQKAFMLLSKYYLEEAKWCNEKYMPNFKDQVELSSMSSAGPVLTLAALMAAGNEATKEAFEWASSVPDMVHACAEIGRFVNDISGFKKGRKNKNDVASSLECYMKEHGTTGEEAAAALTAMVEQAWRRINKAFMEIDRGLLPAVTLAVINQARLSVVVYYGGKDAYTFTSDLEDLITSVFLKPIPV
ncbi:hypothetical protein BDA96_05G143000 [Sorghum bicolor]|uniref:Terpene synthase n=2 Tax=Sorghum bicolor TaxID=4558 RepID=A0A921UFP9_SORBI|nr:alpha-humulene synthase isoform X2 [Sorghum bicolor]KAG0529963.1 hypothetical protein BDA96_05G143000 [Sorghum bicolor]KXG28502.1 hypothetical protein SORBI_3005G130100 [Sorghum bicolor]|eukprot:XP_021316416.1 alpha-humulene synthase isoform X2 [Sorghum bicolor]